MFHHFPQECKNFLRVCKWYCEAQLHYPPLPEIANRSVLFHCFISACYSRTQLVEDMLFYRLHMHHNLHQTSNEVT